MPSSDGATKRQISLEALNFIERHPGPLASKNNETNLYSFKGFCHANGRQRLFRGYKMADGDLVRSPPIPA